MEIKIIFTLRKQNVTMKDDNFLIRSPTNEAIIILSIKTGKLDKFILFILIIQLIIASYRGFE